MGNGVHRVVEPFAPVDTEHELAGVERVFKVNPAETVIASPSLVLAVVAANAKRREKRVAVIQRNDCGFDVTHGRHITEGFYDTALNEANDV